MKTIPALLLAAAFATLPSFAATIALNGPPTVVAGSTFDITVDVTSVFAGRDPSDSLLAFGFNVGAVDGSVLSYTGATIGSLFTDISSSFGGTPQIAGEASAVFLNPGDFTEPLTLATLHFSAVSAGSSPISVTWDSTDLNQGLIFLGPGSGPVAASRSLIVNQAIVTPEPSTLALLAAAGVMAWGGRRSRA